MLFSNLLYGFASLSVLCFFFFFFFNDTATTEIYTLSLHDALPVWLVPDDLAWICRVVCTPTAPVWLPGCVTVTVVPPPAGLVSRQPLMDRSSMLDDVRQVVNQYVSCP